ncbi:methylated-DNA--protein-cysteine methyltransferase [Chiroxiphia lanceolata]|uniref:methylated-DNA--protein-cysteine methyltransferase n=1 Tax=Chiroxiphia lanceolata TaxID=296741 RepID=UPI0013CE8AE5|nr:methylated-DNA--protein-cysteine methyltransferase [Chiroxiphia lanceolata]
MDFYSNPCFRHGSVRAQPRCPGCAHGRDALPPQPDPSSEDVPFLARPHKQRANIQVSPNPARSSLEPSGSASSGRPRLRPGSAALLGPAPPPPLGSSDPGRNVPDVDTSTKSYKFQREKDVAMWRFFFSAMAPRLIPRVNSKAGDSLCKEKHAVLLSPVGKIEISGCDMGLHGIKLPKTSMLPIGAEASAACEVCEGAEEMPEPLEQCMAWLRAYFCEPATLMNLPVPSFHHPLLQQDSFTRQVLWTLLNDVKFGEAVSYKELADLAGNSRAARAVGTAMRRNPIALIIPCHRVIRSGGKIGNYGGGRLVKEWLLSHEKLQKEKLAY